MATSPDAAAIRQLAKPLASAGVALHWLKPKSKQPIGLDWSTAPVADWEVLKRTYQKGANIGVRLGEFSETESGFLHLIDLDIRDSSQADAAWEALLDLWPGARDFPMVMSGSGGESRHIYFFAEVPWASRKLIHSDSFKRIYDEKKGRKVKRWDWEIELFGTGKQAVIPPSIHPDTSKPYEWISPIDLELVEMGLGPSVATETMERWGATADRPHGATDEDDLLAWTKSQPLGLSIDDAKRIMSDLDHDEYCEDRHGWLQLGMALHHEFGGSEQGFLLWDEWSKRSDKYEAKDQKVVWKSFGETRGQPVRMATIKKAATLNRLDREYGEDEGDETSCDIDDMLGGDVPEKGTGDDDPFDDLPDLPDTEKEKPVKAAKVDKKWRSRLDLTEKGGLKNTLFNMQLILTHDPRFRTMVAENEFAQKLVIRENPGELRKKRTPAKGLLQLSGNLWVPVDRLNGDRWGENHDHAVRGILEAPTTQGGYGIKVSDRDLKGAVMTVAHQNRFHPVREYLAGLEWDGVPRLASLWSDYLGTPDTPYYRKTAVLTLVAGIARIYEPGTKFDNVPILEGGQGIRKSTFIASLAVEPSWFGELDNVFEDKNAMIEQTSNKWIMELPELNGFTKSEVQTIKGFISRQVDTARLAYARHPVDYKRQFIIIGSTNETEYLRDVTGGRRFWPIKVNVDSIDIDRLIENRDQLWAEALAFYRELREFYPYGQLPLYLDDEASDLEAKQLQEHRRVEFSFESLAGEIAKWLDTPINDEFEDLEKVEPILRDEICAKEVFVEMQKNDAARYTQRDANEISRALQLLKGWELIGPRKTKKFGSQKTYRRVG